MKAIKFIPFLFTAILLQVTTAYCQLQPAPLKIGDKLPDQLIQNIIGRDKKQLNPADLYKDGLLLIDFWFTSCVPCIREMRMLDSLKSRNPGKFNVVMVTYQDSTQIKDFFKRDSSKGINTQNLYLATNDSVLRKRFPHKVEPHNIWVDKTGTIRAITGTEEVTPEKILGFSTQSVLKTKEDNLKFDPFKEFHAGDSSYYYRSIITPFIPEVAKGNVLKTGNWQAGFSRFSGYNLPLIYIYWQAYSGFVPGPRMQLIAVEKSDSLQIVNPGMDEKFFYNYSLTLQKPVSKEMIRDYIFQDLDRQFGIKAEIRIKKTKCVVVTKVKGEKLPPVSLPGSPASVTKKGKLLAIRNARINEVTEYLFAAFDKRQIPYPFIINIKKSDNVAFDADLDFKDLVTANSPGISAAMYYRLLEKYGFRFNEEIRDYPILILQDTTNGH